MNTSNKKYFITIICILIISASLVYIITVNNKILPEPSEVITTITECGDETTISKTESKTSVNPQISTLPLESIIDVDSDDLELTELDLKELETEIFLPYLEKFEGEFDYYFEYRSQTKLL